MAIYDQAEFDVRCEWGLEGIARLAPISDVVIIVDVLSFTTCVDIVTRRGGIVYPYNEQMGESPAGLAQRVGAVLAGKRGGDHPFCLSPSDLQRIPEATALVLPSPNGSALSLATGDTTTIAGCLRNARAVATYAQTRAARGQNRIALIPAGERWRPEGSLRPALEDLLGVGAIASYLGGRLSPEAEAAVAAFRHIAGGLREWLLTCSSGKELVVDGFEQDVLIAAELNASTAVPRLSDGAYRHPPESRV